MLLRRHAVIDPRAVVEACTIATTLREQKALRSPRILRSPSSTNGCRPKRDHDSSVEVPIAIAEPGRVLNGVIDLMFKSDDGWQIVDYRTDVAASALMFAYAQQLKMYERGARRRRRPRRFSDDPIHAVGRRRRHAGVKTISAQSLSALRRGGARTLAVKCVGSQRFTDSGVDGRCIFCNNV